jgi:mono/diheme cytochrome c family protein
MLASGKALYMQHCAACHGANLEGQPNWKMPGTGGVYPAPPHTREGHTWHHPDVLLLDIIAQGGTMPNSAMPAFGDKLNRDEIETILIYIKSFWGADELKFQREVTQSMQE